MMDIYVCSSSYETDSFASTHIQHKGALIAAILDICEYLGVETYDQVDIYAAEDEDPLTVDDLPWKEEKLLEMDTDRLIKVYGHWQSREAVWSNHDGYSISVIRTRLSA